MVWIVITSNWYSTYYVVCLTHSKKIKRNISIMRKWTKSSLPFQSLVQLTTNNIFTKNDKFTPGSLIHTWCTICISTVTTSSSYATKTISIPRKQITEISKTDNTQKTCKKKITGGLSFKKNRNIISFLSAHSYSSA